MTTWRCPNCGTAQGESSLCFLCGRSATSCGTCVNFRRAIVDGLGYCGVDRKRDPLSGAEKKPCWTSAPVAVVIGQEPEGVVLGLTPR